MKLGYQAQKLWD